MNFDDAIRAHTEWKVKLSSYLEKRDGSLKAAEVTLDNKCALGQWIYGDGVKHSALPEYSKLKNEHARFHKAAAEVIRHADSGKETKSETALGGKSEFSSASTAVVQALMAMKTKAH
jgi:methyl-accepting chemotaxis protein